MQASMLIISKRNAAFCVKVFLCLSVFLQLRYFVQAQAPTFKVIHIPNQAGVTRDQLDSTIALLKDKAAVVKALQKKKYPPGTSIVIRISRQGSIRTLWTIPLGGSLTDKEDNNIILRSKDNATTRFSRLSDFKAFFKDTVAIIDTIGIEVFIREDDYPNDQYQLFTSCNNGNEQANIIPFSKGKLVLTQTLLNSCKQQPVPIIIRNKNIPGRTLATCYLLFLSADQKETLTDLALYYKKEQPESSNKEIMQLVANYAAANMGKLYFPQLVTLLSPVLP